MSEQTEMQKTYNPSEVEDGIYKKWEESGYFNPDNLDLPEDAPTYTIVLPPPNITDKLHLGHAAMLAIEDLLIRYHRMKGYKALWIPGTDHAAIATQNVVEKRLLKEEGLTRHDLGREKFLERVWEFLRETQKTILRQTRKMGASLDWSREAFTLDESRVLAVRKMFIDMYNVGVIYRGERIVNWCPRCHSTLADDEVEYKDEIAKLYWLKYGPFVLATSRPETKLGDTAVAVHPKDERYKDMVGKKYMIPGVLGEFEITVVADRAVDMEFGSGAIKVTPAHDFADYEISQRHNIAMKQIINEDGKMMKNCGKYAGLTTKEARKAIVSDMEKIGLIDHIDENYTHNIAVCYRCGTVIEPLPSKQWFVSVDKKIEKLGNKSLKEKAIEVAKTGEIKFIPDRFESRYLHWMENLHDWCISRQIWFGHRIPVYYKSKVKSQKSKVVEEEIYVGEDEPKGEGWVQDPDSLDTWFSSGMWTFSTLGWPDNFKDEKKSGDLAKFHPTQVLETGYEILTLWVSRMIMMSLFAVGEVPFYNVYLHGMILDKHGKKMSKSKGNGIDPIDMIDKFGTDAVRLSLLMGSTTGNDARLSEEKIEGFRNFTNKLWNIARYISGKSKVESQKSKVNEEKLTLADKWILDKLDFVIGEVNKNLDNYQFSQAGEILKDFTWNDFADWYIEISKFEGADNAPQSPDGRLRRSEFEGADNAPQSPAGDCGGVAEGRLGDVAEPALSTGNYGGANIKEGKDIVLNFILQNLLKLWHPFMPFVTEKIWQEIGNEKMLMIEKWPDQENQKTPLSAMSFDAESSGVEPYSDKEFLRYQLKAATARQYSPDVSANSLYQTENKKQSQKNFRIAFCRNSLLDVAPEVDTYNQYNSSKNFVKSTGYKNTTTEKNFNLIKDIIISIRTIRSENNIEPSKKIKAVICAGERKGLIESQAHLIKNLKTGIEELEVKTYFTKEEGTLPLAPSAGGGNSKSPQPPFAKGGNIKPSSDLSAGGGKIKNAIYTNVNGIDIYLIGAVDFEKEKERIKGEIEDVKKYIKQIEGKLNNQEFVNNAPEAVVSKERDKLAAQQERMGKLKGSLGSLQE